MIFSLDDYQIGLEIYNVIGDVPNSSDIQDGEHMSLWQLKDLLYLDGDYYYSYMESYKEEGFCGIEVLVYAYGVDDAVGSINIALYVDDVDSIIEYLERAL